MHGPHIIARSLTAHGERDKYGNIWQYNSQSDFHSKVACWAALFDLVLTCTTVRQHLETGKAAFGINHPMTNYKTGESKKLDLVVCRPLPSSDAATSLTFASLVRSYDILLSEQEIALLDSLGAFHIRPVANVLVAVEAKACMTKHASNQKRQRGEYSESLDAILGTNQNAIAVAMNLINSATDFVSSPSNRKALPSFDSDEVVWKRHKQPAAFVSAFKGLGLMPKRDSPADGRGFDAIGAVAIEMRNDHSAVTLASGAAAPPPGHPYSYEVMISRICAHYNDRFANL